MTAMTLTRATTPDLLQPQPHHQALLFDWDGTVADSQQVNFESLRAALESVPLPLEQPWFDARTGVSTREMIGTIADDAGVTVDIEALTHVSQEQFRERQHRVGEVPYVVDVLRAEHGRRRTALATGGSAEIVLPTVAALHLEPMFDTIVTRDDVEHGKPSPDIFQLAANRVGVEPASCLVYEDSDEGIAAAEAAGMDCIDVRPLRSAPPQSSISNRSEGTT
jgi:HAD superfamily hydrolase (TIGR01509 family)